MNLYLSNKKCLQTSNYHTMNLYLSNKKMSSTIELPYNEPLTFKRKNVFNHRITIQWTFTFQTKNVFNHTITIQWTFTFQTKNVLYHGITVQWTFTFQTKKCLQPSNYHTMNLYISIEKTSSTIDLPYNKPLPFEQKNVFNHRLTIKGTFTFQTKKCLQPSNYHKMNLYLSNKKMFSTIELPYNEPLPFKQKYVFNHRITIQWTFTFQTKKCLQPSNYHPMNLYISNKNTSSTIELPYNEPLPFKQKNVFNHRITIEWTFTFQTKNVFNHRITIQWTFNFQTKKCLQPSNYHTMNLYLSNKKMSSTIKLNYNKPLTFEQKNVFNHRLTIKEPLPFKQKNVFNHRMTIQWTFTFQTKKRLHISNYHTMNFYL